MINNIVQEHGVTLVKDGLEYFPIELRAEDSNGNTYRYFNVHVGKNVELYLEVNDDVYLCDSLLDLEDWLERTFDTVLSQEALDKLKVILENTFGYTTWR
jgi:hypothetical protein